MNNPNQKKHLKDVNFAMKNLIELSFGDLYALKICFQLDRKSSLPLFSNFLSDTRIDSCD
jgi:hypothetical protein